MKEPASTRKRPVLKPRWRVLAGSLIVLGPGKADLLALVEETGSIRQAATRLGMSYMRAWSLVRVMNRAFRSPLVESLRGGKTGGGAKLTALGRKVLSLYREIEEEGQRAAAIAWARLRRELK